jgi:hypothetical protein
LPFCSLATLINAAAGTDATPQSTTAFIDALFERVLCRPPGADERNTCSQFLTEQTARLADTKKLTSFAGDEKAEVEANAVPHLHARENLAHVLLNHNEFVTAR